MNINIKYREDFDKIYEEIEKVEIAVELVNGKWQTSYQGSANALFLLNKFYQKNCIDSVRENAIKLAKQSGKTLLKGVVTIINPENQDQMRFFNDIIKQPFVKGVN
jgi:hypothetical protein|tara:strand:+ start:357 stop:674 length:318 start_codon:yes stop_codon:yes gene_type:complete